MRGTPFVQQTVFQQLLAKEEFHRHRQNLKNIVAYYVVKDIIDESTNLMNFCNHKNKLNRDFRRKLDDRISVATNA